MFQSSKIFVITLIMLVLATSAYAFTATNTASANHPGYAVSNIVYTFDTTNPSILTRVAFDLNGQAATVKVSLTAADILQPCTNPSETHWICTVTGVMATDVSSLRIVASQ